MNIYESFLQLMRKLLQKMTSADASRDILCVVSLRSGFLQLWNLLRQLPAPGERLKLIRNFTTATVRFIFVGCGPFCTLHSERCSEAVLFVSIWIFYSKYRLQLSIWIVLAKCLAKSHLIADNFMVLCSFMR